MTFVGARIRDLIGLDSLPNVELKIGPYNIHEIEADNTWRYHQLYFKYIYTHSH